MTFYIEPVPDIEVRWLTVSREIAPGLFELVDVPPPALGGTPSTPPTSSRSPGGASPSMSPPSPPRARLRSI